MFYDPKKNSANSIVSYEETQTTNLLSPPIKNSNSTKPNTKLADNLVITAKPSSILSDNPRCPSPQSQTCTGPTVQMTSFPSPNIVITNAAPLDNNSGQIPISSLPSSIQANEQARSNILQLLTQRSSSTEQQRTPNKDVSKEQVLPTYLMHSSPSNNNSNNTPTIKQ
jgi:hypothetical protein